MKWAFIYNDAQFRYVRTKSMQTKEENKNNKLIPNQMELYYIPIGCKVGFRVAKLLAVKTEEATVDDGAFL